jgi:hypothetical protein
VLVFCLGWTKLWWVSRRNKKQAVVDEEKRVKIQELRMSGVIIKLDRENHLPFGVRALQSGVEIDGIWVSTSKTPIPESLQQLGDSAHSSDSSFVSNDEGRPFSPGELSPPRISFSGQLQPAFPPSRVSVEPWKTIEGFRPSNVKALSRDFASAYKPRRSSHLRFSSSGDNQVNQDTLSQLEGVAPTLPEKAHHECSPYKQAAVLDSSSDAAADNERSSGSDSDSSLSGKEVIAETHQLVRGTSSGAVSKRSHRCRGRGTHDSDDSATSIRLPSRGGYFSVARASPPRPKLNPFATPDASPTLGSIATRGTDRLPTDEIEALGEFQWPLLSKRPSGLPTEPSFTPGSLHVNKTARKINSGFELLPAGTFDLTTSPIRNNPAGAVASAESVECEERRRSKKLQKRGRDSITGKRKSTTFGKF